MLFVFWALILQELHLPALSQAAQELAQVLQTPSANMVNPVWQEHWPLKRLKLDPLQVRQLLAVVPEQVLQE